MIHKLNAVVLWTRRSRDADKIVGVYTDTLGRLTARATSAARSVAKFVALTEPFVQCEMAIYLQVGQPWGKMVGGRLIRSYPKIRLDLTRTTAAAWVCEVLHRLTAEEMPDSGKYQLLLETLDALEESTHTNLIRLAFAVRFLSFAGFGLDNRDPWMAFQKDSAERARALIEAPMRELGELQWDDQRVTDLQQLAGSVMNDHLARPLYVNRFRQMTGVEI
jgi:hypothetical protein